MFGLHAMYVNPEASENSFLSKSVPVRFINPQLLKEEDAYTLSLSQLVQYTEILQQDDCKYPVFSGDHLIDGLHRITTAKHIGLNLIPVLDFGNLIDPQASGYQVVLPLLPHPTPSFKPKKPSFR